MELPVVLTVAGSDSGGGAGIQADLKVFHACGVHGVNAITSVTSQNTLGVQDRFDLPAAVLESQLNSLFEDFKIAGVKTGMLANEQLIQVTVAAMERYEHGPLVVDPILLASDGSPLLTLDALDALAVRLLPLAEIVTPNLAEAEVLSGQTISDVDAMRKVARQLSRETGCRNVLLKAGHLAGAPDVLFLGREGDWVEFPGARLETTHTHGTGCVLAAAIVAGLAKGEALVSAVRRAKELVTLAIRQGLDIGHGIGPVNLPCSQPEVEV